MYGDQQLITLADAIRAALMLCYNDRVVDFTPGRNGKAPLADSGDKIRITGATTIGYRVLDTNQDGRPDHTVLYDGTDLNGGVLGWLKSFTSPLFLSDFTGDVTVVTVIDDSHGLTLNGAGTYQNKIYGGVGDDTLH